MGLRTEVASAKPPVEASPMTDESIFATVSSLKSAAERQAYLDQACAGNAELRAEVEALLKADAGAGSFLNHPPIGSDATIASTAADDTAGDDAGPVSLAFLQPCGTPGRLGKLVGKGGEYEVIEVVGQGGMGAVLRAFDTKLSRIVAVKVMAPELAANPQAVKRFLREATTAAAVHHDHVVTIHAIDEAHRPPFIVMQFVEGQNLQQKLDCEGALEIKQILRIGSQIAAGLATAHKQGLIHRDVKPANILLENGVERVKITDFGLARATDDIEMTQAGLIAGTPQYMSPEQAKGETVDARSDLFSLGSVLYTVCTGRPAFRAETTMGVLKRVCEDLPRPIREVNAEIPPWLDAIVSKLLAKNPGDRFQTAAEVAELLGQHLAHVQNPANVPQPAPVVVSHTAATPARGEPVWRQIHEGTDHVRGLVMHGLMLTGALVFVAAIGVLLLNPSLDPEAYVTKWAMVLSAALIAGSLFIKQRQQVAYKKRTLRFEYSAIGGDKLYVDNMLLARVGHGSPRELRARIAEGWGAGDEIKVLAKGGIYAFHCRFFVCEASAQSARQSLADARPAAVELPQHTKPAISGIPSDWLTFAFVMIFSVVVVLPLLLVTLSLLAWFFYKSGERPNQPVVGNDGAITLPADWPKDADEIYPNSSSADILSSADWQWTAPVGLGAAVNSGSQDFLPCLGPDGHTLIFASDREGGSGGLDLWMSTRASMSEPWSPAVNLGSEVNTPQMESQSCLTADGKTLVFTSNRPGGHGAGDLWMTTRQSTSAPWSKPVNLEPPINSQAIESGAALSSDGLTLIFGSERNRSRDLWIATRSSGDAAWSEPALLGPAINSRFKETGPCLSADGLTLLFSRSEDGIAYQTWCATRVSQDAPWQPAVRIGELGGGASVSADTLTFITNLNQPGEKGDRPDDLYVVRRVRRQLADRVNSGEATALRELVTAKERNLEAVKAQFSSGRVTPLGVKAAEIELIEARIRLAEAQDDRAGRIAHLQELVAVAIEEKSLTQQRIDAGADPITALNVVDSRLADAQARLERAKAEAAANK